MTRSPVWTAVRLAPLSLLLFVAGCATATAPKGEGEVASPLAVTQRTAVAVPVDLHGFWIAESSTCPPADGQYDGDLLLDISTDRIVGYEEVHQPVAVAPLADRNGWNIATLIDVGPSGVFEPAGTRRFVLEGGILIVESEGIGHRYRRCPAG